MADEQVDRPAPRLAHASAVPVLLSLILLVALWLRLFGPSGHAFDWGDGQFVHPDEGFVGGTLIHNLTFPTGIGDLFNADSGWNPAVAASQPQLTPTGHPVHGSNGFNYGSLPLYLVKIFAALLSWLGGICPWWAGWKGIDQSPILAGRVLSALFDTATIFLVYQIGSRLAGRWTGLYAAALACVAVLPIQLAHFTTVDTILTTFATGTVLASIDLLTHGSRRHYAIAGIWLAAALATKVSAVPLVALVALAHLWLVGRDARIDPWQALISPRYLWERALRRGLLAPASLAAMLTATVATGAALFLFQPYTFSDWSTFWSGVSYQSDLASGRQLIFYTLKWHGTAPIVYPLEQLSRYSLGLPLAALAYAGVAYAALRMLTPWRNAAFLVAFFAVSYFAANGLLYMKYLRYMAPIVPSLCVLAALLVSALVRRPSPSLLRLFGYGCGALVLALTGGYAAAYQHIYAVPLTRLQATCWMATNLPNGSTLAQDAPDEPQPLPACGATAKGFRSVGMPTLLLYEDDSQSKAAQMGAVLAQAQYYSISSRRAIETFWDYGSKYPYTQRFYRSLLGSGKQVQDPLGFTLVASFAEHPQLGRWVFQDYAANQNFNEYDHPPVWIFANTGHLSADALTAVLTDHGRIPDPSLAVPATATPPKPLLLSAAQLAANAQTPTYARMFPPDSLPMRQPALVWLLMVEALGLLTLPFGMRLFGRLADRGFVLAKTAGILLLSWFAWILPSIGLAAYSRSEIVLCLLPVAALSLGWGVKLREVPGLLRARLAPVLLTEAVFLLGFGAWVWVRMLYPDLWHPFDGGEKTMDFSFLNAIVRSRAMPPLDPWFSGGHLNYYYGHFTVATLLKLAGIAPATAVNLAIPTLFALALASCVSIGYTLARRAGVAMLAAAMAMLGGNLYGAEQLIADLQALSPERPTLHPAVAAGSDIPLLGGIIGMLSYAWSLLDGVFRGAETVLSGLAQVALHHATPPAYPFRNWAWAGSRVIDNHQIITEFPFFTFLYGDPHAHLWDIPFVLCVIGLALNLALAERPGTHNRRSAVPASPSLALLPGGGLLVWPAMGVLLGAVGPTNPWDLATMVAILAPALAARSFRQDADWPRTLLSVGTRLVVLIGCALLFYAPFYLHFQSFYSHLGWTLLRHQTPLGDFLTQFGLPIFVLGSYLVHGVLARTRTGASLRARARALEFTLYYWERRSLLPRYFALVRRRRPRMPSSWRGYQHRPRQALTIAVLGLLVIGAAALKLWLLVALLIAVVYALLVAGPVPALLLIGGGLVLLFLAIGYLVLALLSGLLTMTLLLMLDRKEEGTRGDGRGEQRAAEELFLHVLIAVGLLVAAAGEIVYVRDFYDPEPLLFRSNTIFKLYEDTWLLLNLGAAVALIRLVGPLLRRRSGSESRPTDLSETHPASPPSRGQGTRGWAWLWLCATALLLLGAAISPVRMLPERLDQRATAWPALAKASVPPTLDGSAFLRYAYPGEYQAIAWIQTHVAGTPAILQSRYGGYGNFSARVTMFTGMPSVVNWGFEAAQQRYNLQDAGEGRLYPEQVGLRERDVVDTIYTTTDQRQALALLRRYHVGYVYIGTQERGDPALTTSPSAFHGYPPPGLAKFAAMAARGTLTLAYNRAGIQIYQVPQRPTAAR